MIIGDEILIGETIFKIIKISEDIALDSSDIFITICDKLGKKKTYRKKGLVVRLLEYNYNNKYKVNTSFINTNFSRQKNRIRRIDQFNRDEMIQETEKLKLKEENGRNNNDIILHYDVMLKNRLKLHEYWQTRKSKSVFLFIKNLSKKK